jgi:hypothetical protein
LSYTEKGLRPLPYLKNAHYKTVTTKYAWFADGRVVRVATSIAFPQRIIFKVTDDGQKVVVMEKAIRVATVRSLMSDKTWLIRFKQSDLITEFVTASTVEVRGEHLVFLQADGNLVALVVLESIESWSAVEFPS